MKGNNVIEFPDIKRESEMNNAKKIAKELIDRSHDDFIIIFKTDDIKHLFKNECKLNKEYIVSATNVDLYKENFKCSHKTHYFELID